MDDQLAHNGAPRAETAESVAFRAEQISDWQSEVTAFLSQCLDEIHAVSALLQSASEPAEPVAAATSPERIETHAAPAPGPSSPIERETIYAEPAATAESAAPKPEQNKPADENDYNARLANLKKMLAEKLGS